MKSIIFDLLIAGISIIVFLVMLTIGFIRKNRKLIVIAIPFLLIAAGLGIWCAMTTAQKAYNKVSGLAQPRSGNEIYESLLGKPVPDCVQVLNYQDQIIPKIDYAIWLHFRTCPEELKRIVKLKPFQAARIATKDVVPDQPNGNWFKPENLGDSILLFKYFDERSNGQEIYSSIDSTEAYLVDILD